MQSLEVILSMGHGIIMGTALGLSGMGHAPSHAGWELLMWAISQWLALQEAACEATSQPLILMVMRAWVLGSALSWIKTWGTCRWVGQQHGLCWMCPGRCVQLACKALVLDGEGGHGGSPGSL